MLKKTNNHRHPKTDRHTHSPKDTQRHRNTVNPPQTETYTVHTGIDSLPQRDTVNMGHTDPQTPTVSNIHSINMLLILGAPDISQILFKSNFWWEFDKLLKFLKKYSCFKHLESGSIRTTLHFVVQIGPENISKIHKRGYKKTIGG